MNNLTCQQCKQPLQIDDSLSDLTPSNYELIAGSIPKAGGSRYSTTQDLLSKTPAHPSVKAAWERSQANSDSHKRRSGTTGSRHRVSVPGSESFVLLQDSIVRNIPSSSPNGGNPSKGKGKAFGKENAFDKSTTVNPTPLSHHLRSVSKLYALLSSKTELDHPLCDECTHLLTGILNRQLEETKNERDGYIAFEKQVKKERERMKDDKDALFDAERKIEELANEEERALEALLNADRERAALEAELEQLEMDEKALEEEEAEWVLVFSYTVQLTWA
jgi:beclin 1